ncbi:tape measure protein [Kozakia baliensis]|uniref:tape measure protein n=1 Tax=Kozakia baliensis TaxID=153496 RepID=UPI00087CD459|nr:tape measure protein [Kozakia baliensis]AOX20723.1 hypothetical protein A0U90_11010 [Kozakia baliensis]
MGLSDLVPELAAVTAAAALARAALHTVEEQVGQLVQAGDRYTQSVNRIQAVLGSSREVAAQTFNALEQSAAQTGIDVNELTQSFTNFQISLSAIGESREQIVAFTTTLGTLAHVSGTTSAAANRAFKELSEGLATGSVNLRQLKIILQDMPPLGKALADSLHTSVGGLEEMAHQGKLTTDVVAQAIETMGDTVRKQFGSLPVSLATARQNLTTSLNQLRAQIDQSLNLSQIIARWDQFWAHLAQSAANALDNTLPERLANLKAELAQLQTVQASGGSSVYGSDIALQQRIAGVQRLIDQLQKQEDAQSKADANSAASAKQSHEQAEAVEALNAAMKALGVPGNDATQEIAKLSSAIQSGHDATVDYNGATIKASQVIDLLRQKASPAAAAIADLNAQMRQATAQAKGGFAAMQLAANLKADPLDPSGNGSHLSDDQRKQMQTALDGIGAAQGQDAVRQAQRRLALAQARQRDATGLAAGKLQAGYDRDDFIREHGAGAGSQQEAGQLYNDEISAAQIEAMQKGARAAKSADDAVSGLRQRIAELQAGLHDGGTEFAKWQEKLRTASPAVKAQAASILADAQKIDQLTAAVERARKAQEALEALRGNVTKAQSDASEAAAELAEGPQPDFTKQLDRMKRQQAELVAAAQADTSNPERGAQAKGYADQAFQAEALAKIREQVNQNKLAAAEIGKTWDDTEVGRRKAAIDTVNFEGTALNDAIQKYTTDANERKQLTADTAAFIEAKTAEAMRKTEGATSRLGREWSDTTAMMDGATASFASNFTDTLVTQLATGKASWKSFADSVIQEIERIAIKAALSPVLDLVGNGLTGSTGSGSGGTGWLGSIGKALGAFSGGGSSDPFAGAGVDVGGFHSGGIVGAGEQTFTRGLNPSIFKNAVKYHTGGIAGYEVPAILKRGEGVFTEGQMAAIGNMNNRGMAMDGLLSSMASSMRSASNPPPSATALDAGKGGATAQAPKISMNVTNQTGQDVKASGGTPKFDGESWVLDIVLKNVNKPGNLRNALKGMS